MKYLFSIAFAIAMLTSTQVSAQKVKTIKFEVDGVCGMCKDRIEKAVDVKGVKYANYDLDNHQLEVIYKTKKISENEIHQRIANVGHDTEKIKATDEAYDQIHECCKYREHEHNH